MCVCIHNISQIMCFADVKTFFCVFAHTQQRSKRKRISVSNEILDQSRAATCAGNNCLTQMLTRLADKIKNGAPLKVGVVGKYNKAPFLSTHRTHYINCLIALSVTYF